MSNIYQLLYLAKSTTPLTPQALEQLAAREAAGNQQLGVTGILVYSQGHFIHLLEGQQPAVRSTYNTLVTNARQTNLHILHASGGEKSRLFPNHPQAFLNLDTANEQTRQRLSILCADLTQSPNGRKVLTALRQYRNESTRPTRKAA